MLYAASMTSRFYITTAIPYANGAPHIGHAYERIATDAIARFMRLDGRETLFVTGMDEHGLKMQQTAAREGVTPQAFADRVAAEFEAMGDLLNARADDIVRTTQAAPSRAPCRTIWRAHGRQRRHLPVQIFRLVFGARRGLFRRERTDAGPDGTQARALPARRSNWVEEESYFFKLSAYADRLLAHYEANPDFVTPEKYRNEIVAFVKRGLNDLSISRTTFDWGVPVPGDPQARHVCLGRRADQLHHRHRLSRRRRRARAFWPADAHVIGKDITRFHCDLLAGVPDVGGLAAAEADRRARLPVQPRREDVEVGRQRRQPRRSRRRPTASIPCAISSCAKSRGARTATTATS